MIFEPVFDAALVKVVLNIAWKCHDTLLRFEFAKADTALILISKNLWIPIELKHLVEHLCVLSVLLANLLLSLESFVEEVRNKACE